MEFKSCEELVQMTFATMVGSFQYDLCPTNTGCPQVISEYIHDVILPELIIEAFSITPNDDSYDRS
jgi:hypothetical protein